MVINELQNIKSFFHSLPGFIGFVYIGANNKVSENREENFSGDVRIIALTCKTGKPCCLSCLINNI